MCGTSFGGYIIPCQQTLTSLEDAARKSSEEGGRIPSSLFSVLLTTPPACSPLQVIFLCLRKAHRAASALRYCNRMNIGTSSQHTRECTSEEVFSKPKPRPSRICAPANGRWDYGATNITFLIEAYTTTEKFILSRVGRKLQTELGSMLYSKLRAGL